MDWLSRPTTSFYCVADNNNNARDGARKLWRFDLNLDGTVDATSRKLIHDWKTTRGPDGMKLDAVGRLYVAAGLNRPNPPFETADSATATSTSFRRRECCWSLFPSCDETTNCAFGSEDFRTLFVTAGGTLWSLQATTPGNVTVPTEFGEMTVRARPHSDHKRRGNLRFEI